jgi:RNA polymerase sigma factor (sigma-70 family)
MGRRRPAAAGAADEVGRRDPGHLSRNRAPARQRRAPQAGSPDAGRAPGAPRGGRKRGLAIAALHDLLPALPPDRPSGRAAGLRTQRLHERYAKQIFRYCLRQLRSREEAEDAAQTVFLNAHRSLEQGIEPRSDQAWLFKIAEHVVMHRRRTIARRARVEFPIDLNGVADLIAAPARELDPALTGLAEALARVPEAERRAVVLREWCGLSYREVAAEVGVSVSAAENLIVRGRRRLAHELGGPGSTLRRRLPLGLASPAGWLKWLLGGGTSAKVVVGATSIAVIAVGSTRVPELWRPAAPAAAVPHVVHAAPLHRAQPVRRAVVLHVTVARPRPAASAGIFQPPPRQEVAPPPAAPDSEPPPAPAEPPAPEVTAEPFVPAAPEIVRDPEVVLVPDPGTTEPPLDPVATDDPAAPGDEAGTPEPEAPPVEDATTNVSDEPAEAGPPAELPGLGVGAPDWAGGPAAGGNPEPAGGRGPNGAGSPGQSGKPDPAAGPPPQTPAAPGAPAGNADVVLPPPAGGPDESGGGPAQGLEHNWVDLAALVDPRL